MVERLLMVRWVVGSVSHGGPLNCFSFQPVLYDWCNKGCGMCYPVSGIVHIKAPLLLLERVAYVVAAVNFVLLSEWSYTICPTPCNCK